LPQGHGPYNIYKSAVIQITGAVKFLQPKSS